MKAAAIILALMLTACAAAAPSPPPAAEMPTGSGPASSEPGFSAWCAANPGKGLCP